MAVAADSHCDFLIPEYAKRRTRQRSNMLQMNCVYSFLHKYCSTFSDLFQEVLRKMQ